MAPRPSQTGIPRCVGRQATPPGRGWPLFAALAGAAHGVGLGMAVLRQSHGPGNAISASLSPADGALLKPHLECVPERLRAGGPRRPVCVCPRTEPPRLRYRRGRDARSEVCSMSRDPTTRRRPGSAVHPAGFDKRRARRCCFHACPNASRPTDVQMSALRDAAISAADPIIHIRAGQRYADLAPTAPEHAQAAAALASPRNHPRNHQRARM
jgi:hypothetical protein